MNDPASQSQEELDTQLDGLVEQFLRRTRRGELLNINSFAQQYAAHQSRLLELLPMLVSLEACAGEECKASTSSLPERIGEYLVLGLLGRGGMGVVYLARHPQLDRKVAIKVLPSHLTNDNLVLKRFQREANAIAQLQHANVVTLFELGRQNATSPNEPDLHYFVMQYVDGSSLDWMIRDQQSRNPDSETQRAGLSDTYDASQETRNVPKSRNNGDEAVLSSQDRWRAIARIGADAAAGLAHAHENEILHRDVKPSNLIVDRKGKTWVTDFGLAKLANEDVSRTDGVAGTLRFIAPERFRGWSDPRSDIYSLGVTLYEIATLRPAIEGKDRAEIIARITESRIKPPRQYVPGIPRDLETIIGKSTSPAPDDRYSTAEEMRQDLLRFLDSQPILARRSTMSDRTRRWVRRNPSVAALMASVVVLLLALTIGTSLAAFSFSDLAKALKQERDTASRSLLLAYVNEAHARSTSNRPGQRIAALHAIKQAVGLLPKVEHDNQDVLHLRNEMIAALTLPDLEFVREIRTDYSNSSPSPNFKYVASSAQDGLFRLRDAQTGEVLWSYQFQGGELNSVSCNLFSPDSKFVVAFSHGTRRIRVFDCKSGDVLIDHEVQEGTIDPIEPVAFDDTSRRLAICSYGSPIIVYDVRDLSAQPAKIDVPFAVSRAIFDGSNQLIAYSLRDHKGDLVACDLESLESKVVNTRYRSAVSWRRTRDGLVVGCADGTAARIDWPYNQRVRFSTSGTREARSVEVNEQASLIAVKSWGEDFQIADLGTGSTFFSLWGVRAKFGRDGGALALSDGAKMRFYRVHSNQEFVNTTSVTHLGDHCLRLNSAGDMLLATSWTELQLWSATDLRLRESQSYPSLSPAARFLSDGRVVAIIDRKLAVCDVAQGEDGLAIAEPTYLSPAFTSWMSVSDNDRIAWQTPDRILRIGSITDLESAVNFRPRNAAAFPYYELSPDGNLLAIADGTIRLFNAQNAELIHDFGVATRGDPRSYFRFRPDGQQMICHTGAEQLLIDLKHKRIVKRFTADGFLGGADWSPDGKTLARAVDSETIFLMNASTLEEIARIRLSHPLGIRTIRFSRDGKSLLACVKSSQIHRWNLAAIRQELAASGLDW